MPTHSHGDLIGFAGMSLLMGVYFCNQQGWVASDNWRYPATNLLGSALIMISLIYAFNLPAMIMELFWAAISVYGLIRRLYKRKPQ
jgi:hypothetical protein